MTPTTGSDSVRTIGAPNRAIEAALALSSDISNAMDQNDVGEKFVRYLLETLNVRRAVLFIQNNPVISDGHRDEGGTKFSQHTESPSARLLPIHLLNEVINTKVSATWSPRDVCSAVSGEYVIPPGVQQAMCLPLVARDSLVGLVYLEVAESGQDELNVACQLLLLVAPHCAATLALFQADELAAEADRDRLTLKVELDDLKAQSCRLGRLGRGGSWAWNTNTAAMSISRDLNTVLGLSGSVGASLQSIWDLEIRSQGSVPQSVKTAVETKIPFEVEIEIVHPASELITTLLVVGEPSRTVADEFVGLAFDIGPQLQRNLFERDQAILNYRIEELRQKMADPLTSIMLDSSTADRFLRRSDPDYAMIHAALRRIENRASAISNLIDKAPTALSKPENYQWIQP